MNQKFFLLSSIIPILLLVSNSDLLVYSDTFDEFDQFQIWADIHGINLVGVNKNAIDLYYNGFDPETDYVDWRMVPGVLIAANDLYKVPEDVIQVMDGKTIYFSTEFGRSYTVLGSFPDYNILEGLERGIILEQNINSHTVIHELGHIVDYHGIQGIYNDEQNIFEHTLEDRNSIFTISQENSQYSTPPDGYISAYSAVNDAENFAENFAYYVIYPNEFRERLESDTLLTDEYEFMYKEIFSGFEFE